MKRPVVEAAARTRADSASTTVIVNAPARLHFGMLDPAGMLGRRFGGIGAAVTTPSLVLSARMAHDLEVTADLDTATSDRGLEEACLSVRAAAHRMLAQHGVGNGVRIMLHQMIPAHHGLGSGTQLALATAAAISRLFDLPGDVAEIARVVGRAQRSAIGTHVFALGGFILEGGRRPGTDAVAPLLSRLPIPSDWRCVLALPMGKPGVSGEAEAAAFAALPPPPLREAEQVAHLTLLGLLPALVEGDFVAFGEALTQIQRINGSWFASAQGGRYAPGQSSVLAETLSAWGATGVGQSSWGPAVYALARDPDASAALARRVQAVFPNVVVYDTPFSPSGATVREERAGGEVSGEGTGARI